MKKHVVCFGDSNTHGYEAETGGRFDEGRRWTCLLQEKLGEEYLIIEEGLSGRTTCFEDPLHEGLSGLSTIHPCLMSHEPVDLLIVMLGTNDTKERFGASPGCIALGLKRLIEKARTVECWRDKNPNILLITPQNIDPRYRKTEVRETMGRGCAGKSRRLGVHFQEIAAETHCHYLDANEVLTVPPNSVDYMHLTEEGHAQLALALTEHIQQIL